MKLITEDLDWMAQHVHLLKEFHNAGIEVWENFIANYPSKWKAYVKKAAAAAAAHNRRNVQVKTWHNKFESTMETAGVSVRKKNADMTATCEICSRKFANQMGLHTHMHKAHRGPIAARRYAAGEHCIACLKLFHTRDRLIQHLAQSSPRCMLVAIRSGGESTEEETYRLDEEDAAFRKQ